MAINFFLRRRTPAQGNRLEYFFLAAEKLVPTGQDRPISPMLPGNSATDIVGTGGSNFEIDLGTKRMQITVSGTLLALDPALGHYPAGPITAPDVIAPFGGQSFTATTAEQNRSFLWDFWADQGKHNNITLGYPDWGAPTPDGVFFRSPADVTISGLGSTTYRLFEGLMSSPSTPEVSGELHQFPFQFTFVVGDS